jgi:hypothetical protein
MEFILRRQNDDTGINASDFKHFSAFHVLEHVAGFYHHIPLSRTMAKEPHETMKRIKRTIKMNIVWGFGLLKSNASTDFSGIVYLVWVSYRE